MAKTRSQKKQLETILDNQQLLQEKDISHEMLETERSRTSLLEKELEAMKDQHSDALEKLQTERSRTSLLEKELEAMKDQHSDALEKLQNERSRTALLEKDLEAKKDQHSDALEKLQTERSRTSLLEKELDAVKDQHSDALAKVSNFESDMRNTIKSKVDLFLQCNEMKKTIEEMTGRVQILKEELLQAKEILNQKNSLIENLKKKEADGGIAAAANVDETERIEEPPATENNEAIEFGVAVVHHNQKHKTAKATLYARDLLRAVFSAEELAKSSLSGRVRPKLDEVKLLAVKRSVLKKYRISDQLFNLTVTRLIRDNMKNSRNQ